MNTFFFMWMKTITLGNSYTYTLISSYPLITNNNNYISIPKAIHSQTVSECVLCAWLYTQHTYKHTATTVTCDGCNIVDNMYDIFISLWSWFFIAYQTSVKQTSLSSYGLHGCMCVYWASHQAEPTTIWQNNVRKKRGWNTFYSIDVRLMCFCVYVRMY